jgi:HEAT repeat protein
VVTVTEWELEFARAADDEARAEAARGLASLETPEAIAALARLFATPRSYSQRVAIVSALSDAQSDATLEAKLKLLTAALLPGQPRDVRRAALDVAAQLDDPRAVALLRTAATSDADRQLREFATAALSE